MALELQEVAAVVRQDELEQKVGVESDEEVPVLIADHVFQMRYHSSEHRQL